MLSVSRAVATPKQSIPFAKIDTRSNCGNCRKSGLTMEPLLTPQDIAKLIGVSYHKVLELILMGDLPAFTVGNAYRIAEADLNKYLEDNRYKSQFPR